MKDIIAIYSKLLISILSFMAPALTLLINVFLEGVDKIKAINQEEIKQIESITKIQVQNSTGDFEKTIKNSLKTLKKQKSNAETNLKLLNPKRQVIRLFIPLIFALIFVVFYIFIKEHFALINYSCIRIGCLSISLICFSYGLYVLYQLFCIVIETKRIINLDIKQDVLKPLVNESK